MNAPHTPLFSLLALGLFLPTTATGHSSDTRLDTWLRASEPSAGSERSPIATAATAETAETAATAATAESSQASAERKHALEQQLADVFGNGRYGFCHDAEYIPRGEERRLCDVAGARQDLCPGLITACANQPEPEERQAAFNVEPLARAVFWLVSGLGVVSLLAFAIRALLTRREEEAASRKPKAASLGLTATQAERGAVLDCDPTRLLHMAEAQANAGDFSAASTLAYAAFLRQLEREQKLHLESTHTNGDLARQLEHAPEERATLREVAAQVEAIQFGPSMATSVSYRTLLAAIQPTIVRALTMVALAIPLLFLVSACNVQRRAFSARVDGTEAFRQVLTLYADNVQTRRLPVEDLDDSTHTVVALNGFLPNDTQMSSLRHWVRAGGFLVLSSGAAFADEELEVGPSPPQGSRECRPALDATLRGEVPDAELSGPPGALAVSANWSTVVTCGDEPYVALRYWGDGAILVVADQGFISNGSLATSDNAHLLLEYLRDPGNVEFLSHTAAERDSPYLALMNANLGGLLWHGLACLLFFYAWQGAAFGRLRLPIRQQRRAFSEHVEALGRLYRKAGATRMVLLQYGAWLVEHMRASTRRGRDTRLLELATEVARRTGVKETEIVRLLAEVLTARDGAVTSNADEDMKTVSDLEAVASKMGGISGRA